jgi:hypothetical protein
VVLVLPELAAIATLHSVSKGGIYTVRMKRYDTCVYLEVEAAGCPWLFRIADDGRPYGLDIVKSLDLTVGHQGEPPPDRLGTSGLLVLQRHLPHTGSLTCGNTAPGERAVAGFRAPDVQI